jgi:hypothetical protein
MQILDLHQLKKALCNICHTVQILFSNNCHISIDGLYNDLNNNTNTTGVIA